MQRVEKLRREDEIYGRHILRSVRELNMGIAKRDEREAKEILDKLKPLKPEGIRFLIGLVVSRELVLAAESAAKS